MKGSEFCQQPYDLAPAKPWDETPDLANTFFKYVRDPKAEVHIITYVKLLSCAWPPDPGKLRK